MGIAYGLFNLKHGNLYPMFVETNSVVPIGVWLKAKEGPYVVRENGRKYTKSKLGLLAYRPGKHLATVPLFDHIGKKQNGVLLRRENTVICEVEYKDDVDWTPVAKRQSSVAYDQCFDHLPHNGFYHYKTNPKAKADWLIVESYKVNRVISQDEVEKICKANGFVAQEVA